ncbi:unnamed protein product [Amoebophrya sp. A25]|nr:unnamed protein product [Amoebophrya sp. A25]|eukprot:GSA25T00021860001.1
MPFNIATKQGKYTSEHFDKVTGDFLLHDDAPLPPVQPGQPEPEKPPPTIISTRILQPRDIAGKNLRNAALSKDVLSRMQPATEKMILAFADLINIYNCLSLDPAGRISPEIALCLEDQFSLTNKQSCDLLVVLMICLCYFFCQHKNPKYNNSRATFVFHMRGDENADDFGRTFFHFGKSNKHLLKSFI